MRAAQTRKHATVEEDYGMPGAPTSARGWHVALLAVAGTLILTVLHSPTLRSHIGQVAVFVSDLDTAEIRDWILSFGAWAPAVYFLVVVAQVIASPIPAAPIMLAGGLLFGVWQGFTLSMAGSVIGSIVVFFAARRWGKPLVIRLVGENKFQILAGRLDADGWWLLVIYLLPLTPDDAVCALAGLSQVSFRRFLIVMVVGGLPETTLVTVLPAAGIAGSSATTWITLGIVVGVLLALGITYRDRLESWVLRYASEARKEAGPPGR
jgi:uncharacterized membrane protein YdjX (TVP38/TMEM64 family)